MNCWNCSESGHFTLFCQTLEEPTYGLQPDLKSSLVLLDPGSVVTLVKVGLLNLETCKGIASGLSALMAMVKANLVTLEMAIGEVTHIVIHGLQQKVII